MIQKIPSRTRHRWRIPFWSGCLHRCGMKPTLIRGFGRHLMTSWAPCLPLIHPGPHIHHGPGAIFTLMSSYALSSQLDPYPRCWPHILESAWMDRGPTAYGPDVLPLWRWYGEDLGEWHRLWKTYADVKLYGNIRNKASMCTSIDSIQSCALQLDKKNKMQQIGKEVKLYLKMTWLCT